MKRQRSRSLTIMGIVLGAGCLAGGGLAGAIWAFSGTVPRVSDVVGVSEAEIGPNNIGWVLDDAGVRLTHDAGESWSVVTPPSLLGAAARIRGVGFYSASLGWVVATSRADQSGLQGVDVFRTSDGGATWRQTEIAPPSLANVDAGTAPASVSSPDGVRVWVNLKAVSSAIFNVGDLYRSGDGGATWEQQEAPSGDAVRFFSGAEGWTTAGPAHERLMWTQDGGRKWSDVTQAVLPQTIAGASIRFGLPAQLSDTGRMATVETVNGTATKTIIVVSEDRGKTWSVRAQRTIEPTRTLEAVAVGQHVELVSSGGTGDESSSDQGRTWTPLRRSGVRGNLTRVSADSAGHLWALDVNGSCTGFKTGCQTSVRLVRSAVAAASWDPVPTP